MTTNSDAAILDIALAEIIDIIAEAAASAAASAAADVLSSYHQAVIDDLADITAKIDTITERGILVVGNCSIVPGMPAPDLPQA